MDLLDPALTVPAVAAASTLTGVLAPLVDEVAATQASVQPVVGLATDALQPVVGLATDVAPLAAGRPVGVADFTSVDLAAPGLPRVSAPEAGAVALATGAWSAGPVGTPAPLGSSTGLLGALLASPAAVSFAGVGLRARDGDVQRSSAGEPSGGRTTPEPVPAPVSGSGPNQPSGGSHGSVAWLSNRYDYLSLPGVVPVSGPLQHVPAPVSFDPGSSPD